MDTCPFRFPLFVDLNGKKAVVVGGGTIALRRIAVLHDFGAEVTVIAPVCGELPYGVTLLKRPYRLGDLEGAFLAVAATDDREVNFQVGQEAKEKNIPVSVADRKEESTFFFPAVCKGEELIAGVVSTGAHHKKTAAAAAAIRKTLEELE